MKKEIWPWGVFEIDETTGLPALPKGLFYRVTRPIHGYWDVQIRRRKGWFSVEEQRATYRTGREPITESNILRGAAHTLTQYRRQLSAKSNLGLVGDYPPNKIGTKV